MIKSIFPSLLYYLMTKYTLLIKSSDDLPIDILSYYQNYNPTHLEDSGFDLPLPDNHTISEVFKPYSIDFKINCAMINNLDNNLSGYYLYPRSSFSKYPLIMGNHVGIIDSGYRGNIIAKVKLLPSELGYNHPESLNKFVIDKGTKLFQICAPDLSPFNIKIVSELPTSTRGSDGFGSTGH